MNRNSEFRFGQNPQTRISRSTFLMRKNVKGTFNTGELIPFYVNQDILPGDTFKIKQSLVVRMLTPIYPTMDNLVCDTYFVATPYRLVMSDFQKFMGENTDGMWAQETEMEIPQLEVPSTASGTAIPGIKTLWAYMGLPIGIKGSGANNPVSVSVLPFRAYTADYNYLFRNQNLIAPLSLHLDNTTRSFDNDVSELGGKIQKVSKLPSYITTTVPNPQKASQPIRLPLGTSAPIYGNGKTLMMTASDPTNTSVNNYFNSGNLYGIRRTDGTLDMSVSTFGNGQIPTGAVSGSLSPSTDIPSGYKAVGLIRKDQVENAQTLYEGLNSGMYADLSEATASTINALRLAFQTQKILEKDIRGTMYPQILLNHFGVISPDGRQQRPEYLGGRRIPLVMNQVAQTSSTDSTSPQGNVSAFSLTAEVNDVFTKSFTEHTIIIGFLCVRQLDHTSQQNIPRQWSRRKRLDFYWPELAHLGEQPVYNKEIYADGSATDNEVFGYQERWAEYKYEENVICGELKSTTATPLDAWHYGDKYNSLPVLSQSWIEETDTNVSRTLAVQNHDQFIFDTDITIKATRPIPVYCTPGLIDHF